MRQKGLICSLEGFLEATEVSLPREMWQFQPVSRPSITAKAWAYRGKFKNHKRKILECVDFLATIRPLNFKLIKYSLKFKILLEYMWRMHVEPRTQS